MMTPQEVSEHAFAKASFGGYNMAMVDEFLDLLTEDYTTLYKENATLKAKMKVLVEKVEEYRSTEDAMRKALLTAQKMADDMLSEAEEKKQAIIAAAGNEAKAKIGLLQKETADEQARLTAAKSATSAYINKLKELHQHEMEYLSSLSALTASETPPPAPAADPVAQTASDITASVEKLVAAEAQAQTVSPIHEVPAADLDDTQEIEQAPKTQAQGGLYAEIMQLNLKTPEGDRHRHAPPTAPTEEEEDTAPTRRMDFSNLQFGRDYEIT